MKETRGFVIFPIVFSMYPIFHLYAQNMGRVEYSDFLETLMISMVATLLLLLLLNSFLRDYVKSGFCSLVLLAWFFSYGHIHDGMLLNGHVRFSMLRHTYLVPLWTSLALAACMVIHKLSGRLSSVTLHLNLVAVFLVTMPLATIAVRQVSAHYVRIAVDVDSAGSLGAVECSGKPDIYYIILDGYAREDILRDYFGYDNSEFIEALTTRGFYVAADSRSNYPQSFLSLASSLNMEYLNYFGQTIGKESLDPLIPMGMIRNSKVMRILDALGYTTITVGSGWGPTDYNPLFDINFRYGTITLFQMDLLSTTILQPVANPFFRLMTQRNRVLRNLDKLAEASNIEGPKFVFAHLTTPHPPFVFNRDGGPAYGPVDTISVNYVMASSQWLPKSAYVEQLIFLNGEVIKLIDALMSNSDVSPVIILQSDHGPASEGQDAERRHAFQTLAAGEWDKKTERILRERMSILNAYHMPGVGGNLLYSSITPVNSFRLLLDSYCDPGFELLEDRSSLSLYKRPYDFVDVPDW